MTIGLTVIYVGMLYFGALIAPGVGYPGRLISQIPLNLLDWAHAPGYGLLAWLLIQGLRNRQWPITLATATGAAASLIFGLWTEIWQASVPGRTPSTDDLMIDAMGIGVAAMWALLGQKPWRTSSPQFESS